MDEIAAKRRVEVGNPIGRTYAFKAWFHCREGEEGEGSKRPCRDQEGREEREGDLGSSNWLSQCFPVASE